MKEADVEWHSWPLNRPGGQQVGRMTAGVLAVHKPTGIAVVAEAERSQLQNKVKAMKQLSSLVDSFKDQNGEWSDEWRVG